MKYKAGSIFGQQNVLWREVVALCVSAVSKGVDRAVALFADLDPALVTEADVERVAELAAHWDQWASVYTALISSFQGFLSLSLSLLSPSFLPPVALT